MKLLNGLGTMFVVLVSYDVAAGAAVAATYYVSSAGDDSNAGTITKPWKTITKVNKGNYNAGDKLYFAGGHTFIGSLSFTAANSHGTASAPILVSSNGTGNAIISSGSATGLSIVNTAGMTIDSLNFVGGGVVNTNSNGIYVLTVLAGNVKLNAITINNVDVSQYGNDGIVIGGWNGTSGFTNVRVTNSKIHDNLFDGMITLGYTGYAHTNLYIACNSFYNNLGQPNIAKSSGQGLRVANADGAVIERNLAYNNGNNNNNSSGPRRNLGGRLKRGYHSI
ncbi:MAG: hypothetical protein M3Y07_11720 [Acidobacteriota bacterium]|nr:hypothetical protein [Acidobacteriota bacterium]